MRRLPLAGALTLALGLAGLTGCDTLTGGGDPVAPPETALRGQYTIGSWTLNEEGCDTPGAEKLSYIMLTPKLGVAADSSTLLGFGWVLAYGCHDDESCADRQDKGELIGLMLNAHRLTEGDDAAGWRGTAFGAYDDNGTCTGFKTDTVLTGAPGTSARLEVRREYVSFEKEGATCNSNRVAPLVDGSCDELEIIEADFEKELGPVPAD